MADDVIARDSGGADSKSRQPGHHQRVSEGVSERRATRGGAGDASRYSTTRRHPLTTAPPADARSQQRRGGRGGVC